MQKYLIHTQFIPGLPQTAFRNGEGAYEGIVMHATAIYNDTAIGERNYETQHWQDAFVHAFVDDTQILQTADFRYVAWHAGQTANQRYLGFELCQTMDVTKFALAYDQWIWLAALQLFDRGLPVVDGGTLLSHKQVSDKWHESNHTDPIEYLASHGKSWANVVADVTSYWNQMKEEQKMIEQLQQEIEALQNTVASLQAQLNQYNDQTVSIWAAAAMKKAQAKGVMVGDTAGHLNPKLPVTREQLVTILDRLGLFK